MGVARFPEPRRGAIERLRESGAMGGRSTLARSWAGVLGCCLALVLLLAAASSGRAAAPTGRPWMDSRLSPDQRAQLLLDAMTQQERYGYMSGQCNPEGHTGALSGIPRLGVPTIYFNDGPAGVHEEPPTYIDQSPAGVCLTFQVGEVGPGHATAMPSPLGLAATFDPRLAFDYGRVVGNEAASKGNEVIFGPDVNIMRDPRGGRTFEAYGEDPFVAARMAVGWIEGLQSQHVIADVKHFMANNEENGRTTSNSIVDERAMHEIYMPAFEAAVKEAHVGTVMAAYNMVNGKYMTENGPLLNGVLKHDWGFPGFVLTDYMAQHSTIAAANAGTDLELPYTEFYDPRLLTAAVAAGQISPATIDDHVRRILRTLFSFGVFDHPEWWKPRSIDFRTNGLVARRIEESAIVLLRNRLGVLPLRARRLRSIAVIGADATSDRSGGGSSKITADHTVSPLQGIITRAGRHVRVNYDDGSDPARAAAVAARSDVALVFAYDTEGEGNDKQCMALECSSSDPNQDGLIERVAAANRRAIVVLTTGSPVLTPWVNRIGGIVEAWYPGEEGGTALASVLFGDTDPGGRLPVTFPVHAGDVPAHTPAQWPGTGGNGLPSPFSDVSFMQIHYSESVLVGYRWYDAQHIQPAFPFGFGLSYTRWRYSRLAIRERSVSFTVRNVGHRAGSDIAQLYVGIPALVPGLRQPPRQLKAFAKVGLPAGAARRLTVRLDDRAFAAWSTTSHAWVVRTGCYCVFVGRSSRDLLLRGTVAVGGANCKR